MLSHIEILSSMASASLGLGYLCSAQPLTDFLHLLEYRGVKRFRLGIARNYALISPMFQTSQLSEEQKNAIRQWAQDGATMAEIQRKINAEWQIRVTYMDTRFLILDLGITLKQEVKEEPKVEQPAAPVDGEAVAAGAVQVTRDEIVIPGMLFSGKVHFSDGEKALWYVDESGRLGLDADTSGYRPSQEDIIAFQTELKNMLR